MRGTGDDGVTGCLLIRAVPRWRGLPVGAFTTRPDDQPVPVLPIIGVPLIDPDRADETARSLMAAVVSAGRELGPALLVIER